MIKPMDKLVARRCFATLYLDYEYPGDDILPPSVTCRILVDGYFRERFYTETIDQAIEYFNNWKDE